MKVIGAFALVLFSLVCSSQAGIKNATLVLLEDAAKSSVSLGSPNINHLFALLLNIDTHNYSHVFMYTAVVR